MGRAFLLAACAGLATAAPLPPKLTTSVGKTRECVDGRWHAMSYNTTTTSSFLDLDTMKHLRSVTCDLDHTAVSLEFTNEAEAALSLVQLHDFADHFLVGGAKWNCTVLTHGRPGLIIRRVVGADMYSKVIRVRAAEARYDEIFSSADINFKTDGTCDEGQLSKGIDKKVCAGYNSNCDGVATAPLPIYTNAFLDIACADCFADFSMDVFVDISIRGFQVVNASAGLRNMKVTGSEVIDAKAAKNWNTAINKSPNVLPKTTLVNFKLGVVPFLIWLEIPATLDATLQFNTAAEASFGAHFDMDIGDAFVSWNPTDHWTQTKPKPNVSFTPVLTTSASLDATLNFAVTPTLVAHFDRLLTYTLVAQPTFSAEVQGSEASKTVCLTSQYDVEVGSTVELDINIPWANIAKDWKWNQNLISTGRQPIEHKCVDL